MSKIEVLPADLESRARNQPVASLDAAAAAELNPLGFVEPIIWGWKRDSQRPRFSRMIYFAGRHVLCAGGTFVEDPFLFYAHSGPEKSMAPVVAQLSGQPPSGPFGATTDFEVLSPMSGTVLVRIISGRAGTADIDRLERLASRQPDNPGPTPPLPPSSEVFDLGAHGVTGCDLLAGSGLSYESGLLMLKEVHDLFWVDDGYDRFCLGGRDRFPFLLWRDIEGTFRQFAGWHLQAARAQPSEAHRALVRLRRAKFLHNVFTDNIDRLFTLVGIEDYVQVRGSGIVNEFYPVEFSADSNALLVVGVSADRRGIIAQARERGLKIVVVNPYLPVSPGAKNLDYLQEGDVYFRLTAGEAVPSIAASTLAAGWTRLVARAAATSEGLRQSRTE